MKDCGKRCSKPLTGLQTPTKPHIALVQSGLYCMLILKATGKPTAHLLMRLSIVSPTPPTWGSNGAMLGGLSRISCPRGRETWGICASCGAVQRGSKFSIKKHVGRMAALKRVVVQLGSFNRVIQVGSNEKNEREALVKRIREIFGERIADDDHVTLQIKDQEWEGMYIDFFENEVPDRAVLKVIVERPEVCLCHE